MEIEVPKIVYASLVRRIAAYAVDVTILVIFIVPLYYYSFAPPRNLLALAIVSFLAIIYKPLLEFIFGKTIGKVLFNLKVVNKAGDKPDFVSAILRNIFFILPGIVTPVLFIQILQNPHFKPAGSATEFIATFTTSFLSLVSNGINLLLRILILVDAAFALKGNQVRTLHDRIAGTFVVITEGE